MDFSLLVKKLPRQIFVTDSDALILGEAKNAFRNYLETVLKYLCENTPLVDSGYIAITGLSHELAGTFEPVAAIGRKLSEMHLIPTFADEGSCLVSQYFSESKPVVLINEPANSPIFKGNSGVRKKLIIKLVSNGDFFGIISLDSHNSNAFPLDIFKSIELGAPELQLLLGDALFSYRLQRLNLPLGDGHELTLESIYKHAVASAVECFGADGSVIRILANNTERLLVKGYVGVPNQKQLEDGSIAEDICLKILRNKKNPGAGRFLDDEGSVVSIGEEDFGDIDSNLEEYNISSYLVFRLSTDIDLDEFEKDFGTIAIFYKRRHSFSYRDIALYTSFCRRISDEIAMIKQQLELASSVDQLKETNIELKEANAQLEDLFEIATRGEMLALLKHNLGHMVLAAKRSLDIYNSKTKKALRESLGWHFLDDASNALNIAIDEIEITLGNFDLMVDEDSKKDNFELYQLLRRVKSAYSPGLKRINMSLDVPTSKTDQLMVAGRQGVFVQALFNLINNSRQAQRARPSRNQKKNDIKITITAKGDKIYVRVSDQGPGINRQKFKNPNEIFQMGKTTREEVPGAGLGLPLARTTIRKYLKGDLYLVDPSNALFEIVLHRTSKAK